MAAFIRHRFRRHPCRESNGYCRRLFHPVYILPSVFRRSTSVNSTRNFKPESPTLWHFWAILARKVFADIMDKSCHITYGGHGDMLFPLCFIKWFINLPWLVERVVLILQKGGKASPMLPADRWRLNVRVTAKYGRVFRGFITSGK